MIRNVLLRKFHHLGGFTHYKYSPSISLQVVIAQSEITHVQKPSCFGHWVECHVIAMLSKNNYSGINTQEIMWSYSKSLVNIGNTHSPSVMISHKIQFDEKS